MTRVLVVSPVLSHPQHQGNSARIHALAKAIKESNAAVDLVYYGLEGLTEEQRLAKPGFWDEFEFLRALPRSRMALPDSWGVDDWCPDELTDIVARRVRYGRYSAVIVNYVWMSKVFDGFDGPLKVLDTHDLFADRHLRAMQAGLEARWFFTTPAEETRGFDRADIVMAIQSQEAHTIRTRTKAEVITLGHRMMPQFLLASFNHSGITADFGYIGSGNPWNLRSLKSIDARLADTSRLTWAIAGTICRHSVAFKSKPFRIGLVDHLEDFYNSVGTIINPMVGGTGLKIKTVEAIAYGKPVVGTADAFEGIPAMSEFHRLTDGQAFVDAMGAVASSATLRQELALQSRQMFMEYQFEVQRSIERLLDRIAAHGRNVFRPRP